MFYEHMRAEAYFPNYGLLKIRENAQSVQLPAYNETRCTSVP